MKKFACQYALLRFRPFIETGEFANVGIVMMAPEARFFGFRLLKRYAHITQFFPQLDRQIYLAGRDLFKDELERFAGELQRGALNELQPNPALARNLFAELIRPREAMLQFAEPRIVLASTPPEKLGQLFDHYIERNFVTREYQERLLENTVRQLLFSNQLSTKYQRDKIGTAGFEVNFPFVLRVEGQAQRIIKPLYLAQADTTKLLNHGGQWVDKIRRLRKRKALPNEVLFPVKAPPANSAAHEAFTEIQDDLIDVGVRIVAANDEHTILTFAGACLGPA